MGKMRNPRVKSYQEGDRYFYKIFLSADPDVEETRHLYDSQQDQRAGYGSEEEATQAGLNQVRGTLLSILEQFMNRWPHGCMAKEWQESLPIGIPVVVWDAFFQYLRKCDYVSEEANIYEITEEGQNLRTQLKEIVGTS